MIRFTRRIAVMLALSFCSPSWGGDCQILNEEGFDPGVTISKAEGALDPSNKHFAVVLYSYRIGESRSRSHNQYLAVLDPTSSSGGQAKPVRVGLSGLQTFETVSIENKLIVLRGKRWMPDDPLCCPSAAGILRLFYSGEGLVPVAAQANPTESTR